MVVGRYLVSKPWHLEQETLVKVTLFAFVANKSIKWQPNTLQMALTTRGRRDHSMGRTWSRRQPIRQNVVLPGNVPHRDGHRVKL